MGIEGFGFKSPEKAGNTTFSVLPILGALDQEIAESGHALGLAQGIGIDQMTDITALKIPGVALQGNLDPILLLQGGEKMRGEARRLVETMAGRPFIFNLGHGVMQPTPPEHVAELVKAIRS